MAGVTYYFSSRNSSVSLFVQTIMKWRTPLYVTVLMFLLSVKCAQEEEEGTLIIENNDVENVGQQSEKSELDCTAAVHALRQQLEEEHANMQRLQSASVIHPCHCHCDSVINVQPVTCPSVGTASTELVKNLTDSISEKFKSLQTQSQCSSTNSKNDVAYFPFNGNFHEVLASHVMVAPKCRSGRSNKYSTPPCPATLGFSAGIQHQALELNSKIRDAVLELRYYEELKRSLFRDHLTISLWHRSDVRFTDSTHSANDLELGITGQFINETGEWDLNIGVKNRASNFTRTSVKANRWHHFVMTTSGHRGAEKFYVDGLEVPRYAQLEGQTLAIANKPSLDGSSVWSISSYKDQTPGRSRVDFIDEFLLKNCALGPDEVLSMYAEYAREILNNSEEFSRSNC